MERLSVDYGKKAKLEFSVVNREPLHQQGCEARAGSSTKRVEDEKSLEASAVVGQLANSVKHSVDHFLTNSVVSTGIVVSGVLLPTDKLFRMEQLAVRSVANLIYD